MSRLQSRVCAAILAAGVLVIFLGGCTAPYWHALLMPSDASFSGIDAALSNTESPAPRQVDVLLIHGMGTHTADWASSLMSEVARALNFPWSGAGVNSQPLANGAVLYQITLSDANRVVRLAAVLWSPVTSAAKKTLCYDTTQASRCVRTRALS